MRNHNPAGYQCGFSLLEVLVALVLSSLMLLMLYSSLYAGVHNWRTGELRIRANDDKRLALSFMRRVTAELLPMRQVGEEGQRMLFRGDATTLQFVSRLPAHHAGGGVYFLRLRTGPETLLLDYRPLARDQDMLEEDIFEDAEQVALLEDIEGIALDYFGRNGAHAEPAWHDEWDDAARLPTLIRLYITAGAGPWAPLVVTVRAAHAPALAPLLLHQEE
ncbi:MAG: prepilin-type N-terminal cleavage/methylation domain-containing protein [Gammaproteobacteria bacterium]|nr:prepilin-type N-terminal cleavage/methylation domain-containing protein [Gammaproteobacteria bacterium]